MEAGGNLKGTLFWTGSGDSHTRTRKGSPPLSWGAWGQRHPGCAAECLTSSQRRTPDCSVTRVLGVKAPPRPVSSPQLEVAGHRLQETHGSRTSDACPLGHGQTLL